MADLLIVNAAIVNVVQIGPQIIAYIKSAKESNADRQRLLCEVRSTVTVCQSLQDSIEIGEIADWRATLALLDGSDGPTGQLETCFGGLKSKLDPPTNASKTLVQALKWPFDKKDTQDIFATVERQKSLLNPALTNDNLNLARQIRSGIHDISKDIERISAHQADERRAVLLDKISSNNYEDFHAGVANSRAKDTGGWLLEFNESRNWEEKPGVLLCKGIPGSGKTVLSSSIVDHLRQQRTEGVAIVKI